MHQGAGFAAKLLEKAYFIFKLTGRAMVRPASSDKWKAPLSLVNSPVLPISLHGRSHHCFRGHLKVKVKLYERTFKLRCTLGRLVARLTVYSGSCHLIPTSILYHKAEICLHSGVLNKRTERSE